MRKFAILGLMVSSMVSAAPPPTDKAEFPTAWQGVWAIDQRACINQDENPMLLWEIDASTISIAQGRVALRSIDAQPGQPDTYRVTIRYEGRRQNVERRQIWKSTNEGEILVVENRTGGDRLRLWRC